MSGSIADTDSILGRKFEDLEEVLSDPRYVTIIPCINQSDLFSFVFYLPMFITLYSLKYRSKSKVSLLSFTAIIGRGELQRLLPARPYFLKFSVMGVSSLKFNLIPNKDLLITKCREM